jgi:small-conductance mechanosensitive channel
MRARTRNILTVVSLVYISAVAYLFTVLSLRTFNALLATVVVPLVWLVWSFCRWSAHQHSERWARDIEKVHGSRPVRQGVTAR